MIDIHNHILPCVDDGSDSLELSRKLLKQAAEEGITDVCITPHFIKGGPYKKRKKELMELFSRFKEETKDIGIRLYLGNELFIDSQLDELLLNEEICSMNESEYVLIEFPFDRYRSEYDEYLYNVSLNYKIIIAHPERYGYVQKDIRFTERWTDEGYYLQSNQDSLKYRETRKVIYSLIEKGKLSFLASDCHNLLRPLHLSDAYAQISRKFSKETAELLMNINPMRVIKDEAVKKVPSIKKHLF